MAKYLQSKIGDTYKQAKDYLQKGVPVYFSATPCQIAGLYAYLGKDYDNLVTQDLICHGVPSPSVWQKYVGFREEKSNSQSRGIDLMPPLNKFSSAINITHLILTDNII